MTMDFEAMSNEELDAMLSTIYNIKNIRRENLRLQLIENLEKAWEALEDAGFSIELAGDYYTNHTLRFDEIFIGY